MHASTSAFPFLRMYDSCVRCLREEVVVSKMELTILRGAMEGEPKQGRHNSDRSKEHMGLTTWANAPDGRILKSDVLVAKTIWMNNR